MTDKTVVERAAELLRSRMSCPVGTPESLAQEGFIKRWHERADKHARTEAEALQAAGLLASEWNTTEPPKDKGPLLIDFGRAGVHLVEWTESVSGTEIWCVDDRKHGPYALRGYSDEDIRGWMFPPKHIGDDNG